MKIINSMIKKFGKDRLLQYCVGATILSITMLGVFLIFGVCTTTVILGIFIGNLITIILSFLKEKEDKYTDNNTFKNLDIINCLKGSGILTIIIIFIYFIML